MSKDSSEVVHSGTRLSAPAAISAFNVLVKASRDEHGPRIALREYIVEAVCLLSSAWNHGSQVTQVVESHDRSTSWECSLLQSLLLDGLQDALLKVVANRSVKLSERLKDISRSHCQNSQYEGSGTTM